MDLDIDYEALARRLGAYLYRQRIWRQKDFAARSFSPGRTYFHPENARWMRVALRVILKACGVYWMGERHACAIRHPEQHVAIPGLHPDLDGYRILHLSDLHFDIDDALAERIIEQARGAQADICVITGDYCAYTLGDPRPAMARMKALLGNLSMPVYAVLGNHDRIEVVSYLEAMGARMLMNEHVILERGNGRLALAGVDDPHLFETNNLEKALDGIPGGTPVVLLVHTAEIYRDACAAGVQLLLCGHTHGGQICLPGGIPIIHNAQHPRRMNSGPWHHQDLQGYTSRGTGACMVPVRFFCHGEMVTHVLTPG